MICNIHHFKFILNDFWSTGDDRSKGGVYSGRRVHSKKYDSLFNAILLYCIYALKSVFMLNLIHIFSLLNDISLVVLKSPARLLNDTTAVYLWSSSTVSVVLTVSILVSVS